MNQAPSKPPSQPQPDKANTGLLTIILHHSITVLILVLFLALGVWAYLNVQTTEFFSTLDHDDLESQFYPPLERAQQQRMEAAIEVFSLRHDRHPRRLEELTESGLLRPADLYYPRSPEYWAYETRGENYSLQLTPPPDDE